MNILHLIESSEPGGAETVVLSLVKGLRDRGHHSVIGLIETGWLEHKLKEVGFETILVEQNRSYDPACLRNLCNVIRRFRIDLIHSHEFMMNVYGTVAGLFKRIPVIATVHGNNYVWLRTRRRVAYRLVSLASKMVAVSEDLKCFLTDRVGISKSRIITIYNGIDCEQYNGNPSTRTIASLKASLSISPESPVIGTVGMLVPVKDHMTIVNAAIKVIKYSPDVVFLIIGDGELLDPLKAEKVKTTPSTRITKQHP